MKGLAASVLGLLFWAATVHANPYYDPTKAHHAPDGFRKPGGAAVL